MPLSTRFCGVVLAAAGLLAQTSCSRLPAPRPATASAPERLAADTPRRTVEGATFIAPADWSVSVRGAATIVEAPEADSRIALVDVRAPSADSAVTLAWAAYMPDHTWPLKVVTAAPDRESWSERRIYSYPHLAQ